MNKQTKILVYFFTLGILLRQVLIRRNKIFIFFFFNADNYWTKSRKQQSERQRGKETVEQMLRKNWKEGNYFSQELKALAGAHQPWRRSSDGTASIVRRPSLCKELALATGDRLFFLKRKELQTTNPVSHLRSLGTTCSCLVLVIIIIIINSSRSVVIMIASFCKSLKKSR